MFYPKSKKKIRAARALTSIYTDFDIKWLGFKKSPPEGRKFF